MSGETFYGLREMVLPGPAQTSGYRTILVIGTTGAGKSTLLRQLMGTTATDGFPATSASKTTVAETEVLAAPGDYYAVATFMPLVEMRAYLEENVVNAALAIFDDRPGSEVRSRLLDHVDQRFRLRYLMGEGLPGGAVAGPAGELSLADQMRENTEAILTQIHQLLEEAVTGELGAMVETGAATADTPEEELHVLLKDRLALNTTIIEITDFLVSEVRARVELLCPQDIVASRDGWPLYWRCHRSEREEFLTDLRRFAGNDATQFGTLLTPLVNGLRVRGPFHPDWAAEIPYVMLIDREGLGHTPDSVSSLPSSTTRMLDEVDTIVLVDNAQQPMQAAPVAAIRQIAAAGYGDKLVLCFTHFEMVHGPNLPDTDARRHHVIASVDQVLTAIGNELGYPTERLLRQRLDRNLYLLSRLQHRRSATEDDAETLSELRWLLGQLRVEAEPLDLGASRPVYSAGKLTMATEDAIASYLRYWELRLGVGLRPDDPAGPLVEDQGAVRPLRPPRQRRVRVDAAGRRPAGRPRRRAAQLRRRAGVVERGGARRGRRAAELRRAHPRGDRRAARPGQRPPLRRRRRPVGGGPRRERYPVGPAPGVDGVPQDPRAPCRPGQRGPAR